VWKTVSPERDLTLKQCQSVRSAPSEEEGAAQKTCDELTLTPVLHPSALLVGVGGGRRKRKGGEVEPGKKGGVGGRRFKIWFYFSLSYSDLIGDKLNSLFSSSSVCFVCDSN